jgi:hypothetical protein
MTSTRQESGVVELHFDCHCVQCGYYTGLTKKVLSLLLIFDLAHTSSFVCILVVALCPYVSIGIVVCLGKLLAINNDWTDWFLIIIIVGNIHQSLLWVDQCKWGFNLDCIPFCIGVRTLKRGKHLFTSYWCGTRFSCYPEYSYQWLCSSWQSFYGNWNHVDTSQLNNTL